MGILSIFWPRRDERRLLGRFYLVDGIAEFFNLIWPFQFAYLFMVMERPDWAVIPILTQSLVSLLAQIPTGAFADRYGRRRCVILGDLLTVLGIALIPSASQLHGSEQLVGVCIGFGIMGFGQAMVSGAGEAWVIDNLAVAGREELAENYFGRVNSFIALGGAGAGLLALLLLMSVEITRQWLDMLWYIAAAGILFGVAIQLSISEQRPPPDDALAGYVRPPLLSTIRLGFRALRRSHRLLFFVLAVIIASFPEAATDDAFDMSLITKGMDARGLAPLAVINNLIGITAPLLGMVLLRRYGATPVLSLFLILPALLVCSLFVSPILEVVIVLYVLLDFFDGIWDPVAEAHLQTLIRSESRATVVSIVSYAGGMMEMFGIAVFAWLLGEHSEALSDSVPDLISAFSGEPEQVAEVPRSLLQIALPDLAILIFVFSALLALPFVFLSARVKRQRRQP
ncbi:MAG: MFS transporter [Chromatiales bacterium]|jgi:MFS family permease